MKKYLVLAIIFTYLLPLVPVSNSYAAGLGEYCGTNFNFDGSPLSVNERCDDPAWSCVDEDPNSNLDNWTVCRAQEIRECTCSANGSDAPGANGWTCAGSATVGFCPLNEVCSTKPGQLVDVVHVPDAKDKFAGQTLKGVECKPSQAKANCRCIGRGTVNENNFECELESDPTVKGTATCRAEEQCTDVPADQGVNNIAQNQQGPVFTRPGGVNMFGIKCDRPVAECTCDNPGAIGNGRNTFTCTQFGRTETDTCDASNYACTNVPGNILVGGIATEDQIFSGAPLRGIDCRLQRLPPPPSPPCKLWVDGKCDQVGTAVGDLSTKPENFITRIFAVLLSMSGGIALLLIIKAGYQMMTSQGNPEKLNNGRDQLIAAIVGLVFLIFSFIILQIIGFDILRLPGFGGQVGSGGQGTTPRGALCNNNNDCVSGVCGAAPAGPGGNSGQCQ